jgi:tetratricopeptide (TPR) repeat protein
MDTGTDSIMPIRLLFFGAVLGALAGLLGGCGGAEERKAEHLERGRQFLEAQNFDKAKVEFKNVLQIDPKAAQPYFYLGRIEEARKNWRESFAYYRKAAQLDPEDLAIKTKLAQFLMLARQLDEADVLIGAVLAARPGDPDARMLKAAVASLRGDKPAAIAEMRGLIEQNPVRADAYGILALFQIQQENLAEAERTLEQGLEAQPDDPELLGHLARLSLRLGKPERTEAILKRLVANNPAEAEPRNVLAAFYLQQKRPEAAERVYREAITAAPEEAGRYLALAEFLAGQGRIEAAGAELRRAIEAHPREAAFRFALAGFYERLDQRDRAEAVYRDLIAVRKHTPDALKAKNRLALMAFATGRDDSAAELIGEVLKDNPADTEALRLRGRLALVRGESQAAIAAFRSILKDQPDSVDVLHLLAEAHLLDGKPALAQEALERAVAADPSSFEARRYLVEFRVRQNDAAAALETLDDFLKLNPNRLDALSLKADVLALGGKTDELEAVLKEIETAFPDNPTGPFRLGRFHQAGRRYEAALAAYEKALGQARYDYGILESIAAAYVEMGQPDQAVARLRQAAADWPREPGPPQLLGKYLLDGKQNQEGVAALERAIALDPRWPAPYLSLGGYYESAGQPERAVETYRRGLAAAPNAPALRLPLARVFESLKDYPKAIAEYDALLAVDPGHQAAANNLATLLSLDARDRRQLERALSLARPFETSGQPFRVDTLAWIHYQLGDFDKALALQSKVVEQAPGTPVFHYHLGMIYLKKDQKAAAREQLRKAVESGQDFIGAEEARHVLGRL